MAFKRSIYVSSTYADLKAHRAEVKAGRRSPGAARQSLLSWNAHLAHGHTIRLRRRLYAGVDFAADLP